MNTLPIGSPVHRRLGRILVEKGVITEFQLHHALAFQRLDGRLLGEVLLHLGLVSEEMLARALEEQRVTDSELAWARLEERERELLEREERLAKWEHDLLEREAFRTRQACLHVAGATRSQPARI